MFDGNINAINNNFETIIRNQNITGDNLATLLNNQKIIDKKLDEINRKLDLLLNK